MGVDSYLEIFTTLYGWRFANVLTGVMFETGLYLVPILFVLVATIRDGYEQGFEGDGAGYLIRRLQIQLFVIAFMSLTCVQTSSLTSLSRIHLTYRPPATTADPTPAPVDGTFTGTTFDEAFADVADDAAIPMWWYTVMSLSSGVSSAMRSELDRDMRNIRAMEDLAHTATIEDPQLRSEIQHFYSACYVPARSRFDREEPSPEANAAIALYGPDDIQWIGSHAFQDDPNLYGFYRANYGVVGFPFDAAQEDLSPGETPPTWGRPRCVDWWAAPTTGLRERMIDAVGRNGLLARLTENFGVVVDPLHREDALARLAMTRAAPVFVDNSQIIGTSPRRTAANEVANAPTHIVGGLGVLWEGLKASATMMAMINLMLMAQPLILMAVYMFLPLATIVSGYNLKVFVYGAMTIFTVKFWSVLWFVARWIDDHLILAMHPPDINGMYATLNLVANGYKRVLLNILLMMLFAALPIIWTAMMGWVGIRLGDGISGMLKGALDSGNAAGGAGLRVAQTIASKGASRGR